MEEVCKVGHKNLQKNFWGWRTFLSADTSILKVQTDNFMSLFWTFAGVPNCMLDLFLCQESGKILK